MEIRRDRYLERLIAHKGNGRVKIVTGIRRCGERGDGFSDLKVQSVAVQSCFTNNRSQQ